MSIIETTIKLTTALRTSNYSPNSTTSAAILDATKTLTDLGLSPAESAECINQLLQNTTNAETVSVLGAVAAVLKTLQPIREKGKLGNTHSTVKPTALMRYLVRLVTPPGGIVLDPFMGSGSTGKAALLEGFKFFGVTDEQPHMEIAERRLKEVA
jgi:DNA modification methylase